MLKSAGASWRNHLSTFVQTYLGYKPCKAGPGIYLKPNKNQMLISTSRTLSSMLMTSRALIWSPKFAYFRIKDGDVGESPIYIGATIKKQKISNETGQESATCAMGSIGYVSEVVRVVEERMTEKRLKYFLDHKRDPPSLPPVTNRDQTCLNSAILVR